MISVFCIQKVQKNAKKKKKDAFYTWYRWNLYHSRLLKGTRIQLYDTTKYQWGIITKVNNNSYQVTCADDVRRKWFENVKAVGVSAGASTPDELIEEVKEKIEIISKEKIN